MPRLSKIGAAALAAFGWTAGASVTASYLVVAGGSGGGVGSGGGGGAGGYRTGTTSLNPTLSYTVTVGAGGASGTTSSGGGNGDGGSGSDSIFSSITATAGGYGAGGQLSPRNGGNGGSGGGGSDTPSSGGTGNTPSTSPSQGSNGGAGSAGNGGGGGGAGAVGTNASGGAGGNGGAGTASSISGSSVTYAGGGGGAGSSSGGTGGSGGGGAGGTGTGAAGNGTANLGGGGGGTRGSTASGAGGSGIVIISYAGAQQFGGGVVTSSGGNTIHTFTTSGTLSPLSSLTASALIVAGGGGGSYDRGGGGGAGGFQAPTGLTIDTNSIYVVTVGSGGAGATSNANGTNGTNSTFSVFSTASVGGGGGASYVTAGGNSGGSGGGGSYTNTGGAGTSGQGNAGGNGESSVYVNGGGGGGAGAAGQTPANSSNGGNGGNGSASSISGASVTYAGGGGGGHDTRAGGSAGTGGTGGGGAGGMTGAGTAGTANTGGGGGGGGNNGGSSPQNGGAGGSGIVIISYPGSTPQMAGGTVTAAGGNIIHTFTSSGYLTPITNLNNSLRFRSSASAYLNRTPTVAGNRKTWTWSGWVKRGTLGTNQSLFTCYFANNDTSFLTISFTSDNLNIGLWNTSILYTSAVYRDPSAWYHIVLAIDTTQATASDRAKLYVNGVQVTAFGSTGYPAQNTDLAVNAAAAHYISTYDGTNYKFDGYMAECYFIDGQALTPSSFGAFNGQGVWQPVRYGGSYGTNGFYLPFTGSSSYYGSFNGSTQYLQTGNATNLALGTGDFTIEGWFNRSSGTNNGIFQLSTSVGGFSTSTSNTLSVAAGSGVLTYYAAGTSTNTPSLTITNSAWNHFALVRSGTTTTLYYNGVSVSTISDSTNYTGTYLVVGGYYSTSYTWNGQISNFRVVKGTALYTSNFNPATAPLTAVTGTQFLTLQSATIVDNSTNSYAITNNGTVATTQAYPFTMLAGQSKDYSPQGNNWTNNNIGVLAGSTLDIMTDVPTLTSATQANYGVINPNAMMSNISVTNGNLTTSFTSLTDSSVFGTFIIPTSGKWYFEGVVTTVNPATTQDAGFGIVPFNTSLTSIASGASFSNGVIYRNRGDIDSRIVVNGSSVVNGTTYSWSTNDIVQLAYDADTRKVWVGRNNSWFDTSGGTTGNPSSGTNQIGTLASSIDMIFVARAYSNTLVMNWNFGQRPFTYTPPSGFVALNTFNLPTPTIGATPATTANKYMDVSLYTGNGSTQSITNSGSIQPDFVWIKSRSAIYQHNLYDAVRGATNALESNTTSAAYTLSGLTAFNSNGFALGSNAGNNNNGSTYVGWQWRASNTTAVTNTAGSITSTVSANTTAGFSIVTWTGSSFGSSTTVGHGLGVAPSMIIIKARSTTEDWYVYHASLGLTKYLRLNLTDAVGTATNLFNTVNSTVFNPSYTSTLGITNVAYCFAQVAGYSAFGSYTGNGSTDGPFVYTGFRPRFILFKNASSSGTVWVIFDTARNTYNFADSQLRPNESSAENSAGSSYSFDILSNGFKVRSSDSNFNGSGDTMIYAAFAESPFKYANAR